MIDRNKRRTLKWFTATPLAAMPLAGMAAFNDTLAVSTDSPGERSTILDVEIIDTNSVSDNSVLLHNAGRQDVIIHQFTGGNVVFNDRLVDMNLLVKDAPLMVSAGRTESCRVDIWSMMAAPEMDYVYADHAVEYASQGTSIVRLGLYLFDDKAFVYAQPARERLPLS